MSRLFRKHRDKKAKFGIPRTRKCYKKFLGLIRIKNPSSRRGFFKRRKLREVELISPITRLLRLRLLREIGLTLLIVRLLRLRSLRPIITIGIVPEKWN